MRLSFQRHAHSVLRTAFTQSYRVIWALRDFLLTRQGLLMLSGVLAGFYLVAFTHQFFAGLGTSLSMLAAGGFAMAFGAQLAAIRGEGAKRTDSSNQLAWGTTHFGLAVWVVLFHGLVNLALIIAGRISAASLAQPSVGIAFAGGSAVVLLALPAYLLMRLPYLLPHRPDEEKSASAVDLPFFMFGVALGLFFTVMVAAPLIGIRNIGLSVAACGMLLFVLALIKHRKAVASREQTSLEINSPTSSVTSVAPTEESQRWIVDLWTVLVVALFGALLYAGSRMLYQLMPAAGYLVYLEWALLAVGMAAGLRFAAIQQKKTNARQLAVLCSYVCLFVAASAIGLLACEALLVDALLALNAYISFVWLMMLVRVGVLALLFLPVGFGWGVVGFVSGRFAGISRHKGDVDHGEKSPVVSVAVPLDFRPLAFIVGYVAMRAIGVPQADLSSLFIGVAWILSLLGLLIWLQQRSLPKQWHTRSALVAAGTLVALAPLFSSSGDAGRAAKVLFASNVFQAKQRGVDSKFLPVLDEGRLLTNSAGDHGTYTLWKYRGAQLQLRESGMPKSVASIQADICPAYSPERMHSVLPLVLHEGPADVLLLGLGLGDELETCLAFPIPSITCIEGDGGLLKMLKKEAWPRLGIDPLADDRVRLLHVDPTLAVADSRQSYDVIISRPDQSSLWKTAPQMTREFYRRASARLTSEGIFCQRFQQIDYGPDPLRVLAKTMQSAFAQVIAIETGPGNIVMLATNSSEGVVCDGFKERLQKPHVRRALAQLGWDWTVPLSLVALDHDALRSFADETSSGLNTAGNGLFTYRLPQEVIRWGPKWQQQRESLSRHATRMLAWPRLGGDDPEVFRRLSEVAGRHTLMAGFPDQKWAYRKALRDQMTKQRESLVQKINRKIQGGKLHPQDKLRKFYLEALGDSVSTAQATPEKIQHVADFTEPFDPLLSYFAHHEVAELLSRAETADPQSELYHRLHLAYYAIGEDRSVRNVAAAIDLLAQNPECVSNPVERFDYLNGLLQVLKSRWDNRGTKKPKRVQYTLNDVEKSVSAIDRSFEVMDSLAADLDLKGTDWESRRQFLDKTLARPLRSYRHQLLALHLKQQKKTEEILSGEQDSTEVHSLGN